MTEPFDVLPTLPAFVRCRDGRLIPFDPDIISRTLFQATARLGRPDAFLARELTDGLLHFLATDADPIPTTEQIRELAIKVVRELGQPALAAALSEQPPATPPTPGSLFGPDLVAAHHDGLLVLGGLDTPLELASCVLKPPDRVATLRQVCGQTAVIDGPEHVLTEQGGSVSDFARELVEGLHAAHLKAVVNLNTSPPPWADDLAEGPLFAAQRRTPDPNDVARTAEQLLEMLTVDPVRVDWHLSAEDFAPDRRPRLHRVVERALAQYAIGFVFDRPRRAIALAEGVDRRHPAVLLSVGLDLHQLAVQVLPGLRVGQGRVDDAAVQRFLSKLPSLARMALSAALQKRDYLRRQAHDRPALTRGFLLDRARLMVTPIGLEKLVQLLLGRGLGSGSGTLELTRRVVGRLRDVLRVEGQAVRLTTCLDGLDEAAWNAGATVEQQLQTAGHLHAGGDTGTAILGVQPELTVEAAADLLRLAWERTEVVRLIFRKHRNT